MNEAGRVCARPAFEWRICMAEQAVVKPGVANPEAAPKTEMEAYMEMVRELRANRPATVKIEVRSEGGDDVLAQYAAVNGVRMLIPKDTQVEVPYEIAQVLRESRLQDLASTMRRRKLADDMNNKLKEAQLI